MSRSTVVPSGSVDALLSGFSDYLRDQRCLSRLTIEAYVADVRRFLTLRGHDGLLGLTAAMVIRAILNEADGRRAPATVRRYACSLRCFLRYGHFVGLIDSDLSAAAMPWPGRRSRCCPKG